MKKILEGTADLVVFEKSSLTSGNGINIIKIIDNFSSLIWTRKFAEPDEFELVVPTNYDNYDVFRVDNLVMITDYVDVTKQMILDKNPEIDLSAYEVDDVIYKYTDLVGIIEKIDVKPSDSKEGMSEMVISGRSLESLFDRRITWNACTMQIFDGENTDLYNQIVKGVYGWLEENILAPGKYQVKKNKVKYIPEDFDNRAIWNIVLANYGDTGSEHSDGFLASLPMYNGLGEEDTQCNPAAYELFGENLLKVIEDLCESTGLGFRMYLAMNVNTDAVGGNLDVLNLGKFTHIECDGLIEATQDQRGLTVPNNCSYMVFELYAPYNRSYENNDEGNPFVVFSQNMDNLKDIQYVKDETGVKNVTLIFGANDDKKKTYTEKVYNGKKEPSGWNRKEIYTDATDIEIEKTNPKWTEGTYLPALRSKGRSTLIENSRNRNFVYDGSPIMGIDDSFYVFGEDFFVGDYVQFFDEVFRESIKTQVSEVVESLDETGYSMTISYATPITDFDFDDPLGYYYYTVDDENEIITITGIKLTRVMEDELTNLAIIESLNVIKDPITSTKKKKTINKDVSVTLVSNNPDEIEKIKSMSINAVVSTGAINHWATGEKFMEHPSDRPFGSLPASTVVYKNYQIKLNLTYSH